MAALITPSPEAHQNRAGPGIDISSITPNWVGALIEYRNANRKRGKPVWTIESRGSKFVGKVAIPECPDYLGDEDAFFLDKSSAKKHASQRAIEWLVRERFIAQNSEIFSRNNIFAWNMVPLQPPREESSSSSTTSDEDTITSSEYVYVAQSKMDQSWPQKVVQMCEELGCRHPAYHIEPSGDHQGYWNVYAVFDDPKLKKEVGHVTNSYGKVNARRECARLVAEYLKENPQKN